jgi:hypothetical protein
MDLAKAQRFGIGSLTDKRLNNKVAKAYRGSDESGAWKCNDPRNDDLFSPDPMRSEEVVRPLQSPFQLPLTSEVTRWKPY